MNHLSHREDDFDFFDKPAQFLVRAEVDSGIDKDLKRFGLDGADTRVLSGSDAREYRPLEENPALFREFADTKPDEKGILKFATRWGALGSEGTCVINLVNDDDREKNPRVRIWGEATELWEYETGSMHDAVAFWDAAHNGQREFLEESIQIEGDLVRWFSEPDGWDYDRVAWVTTPSIRPERLAPIRRDGLARAAQYIVQDLINDGLRARVHEQLGWNADQDRLAIQIVPINLIGAMWLQFATAVEARHGYGQCEVCKTWFEVAPGSGRPEKRYCSNACRMRAYRKRKAAKTDATQFRNG